MSWGTFVLALMKVIIPLIGYVRDRQLLNAGQDKAIAKASLEMLAATRTGKELRDRITALSDTEAETLWHEMLKNGN